MDVSMIPKNCAAVTKSDTEPNNGVAFMVNVAGNVAIVPEGGGDAVTLTVLAGIQYSIRFSKIMSTNTTATGIVRFY